MRTYEVNGFYGSGRTPDTIYVCETRYGRWYCADDSRNVMFTYDDIEDGVWIEELSDNDSFNWSSGICSQDELEDAVRS